MTRITVLGGTGYVGGAIAREAAARGHEVVTFSRGPVSGPAAGGPAAGGSAAGGPARGVVHVTGSALVPADLRGAVKDAQVIGVALAPSGALEAGFTEVNAAVAEIARENGARLGVVGGAGSLLVTEGGSKVYEAPEFPEQFRGYARASDAVLRSLRDSDPDLDWFVLSPPRGFGSYVPGEETGKFRLGGDVMLADENGRSYISGADFAIAFVDEIDRPAHRRERFTAGY